MASMDTNISQFDTALAKYAMDTFSRQGIEVKTEHHLERVGLSDGDLGRLHGGLKIKVKEYGDKEVGAGLVVWSTGLMQNHFIEKLTETKFKQNGEVTHLLKDQRTGGIITDPSLRARTAGLRNENEEKGQHLDDVFVIGDCSVLENDPHLPKVREAHLQHGIDVHCLGDWPKTWLSSQSHALAILGRSSPCQFL
jgi:NADH dehydrogenase FAD-containing subunit